MAFSNFSINVSNNLFLSKMEESAKISLNSDMVLVFSQVKNPLYIVGLKAGESSDTSTCMSSSHGVGHIQGH